MRKRVLFLAALGLLGASSCSGAAPLANASDSPTLGGPKVSRASGVTRPLIVEWAPTDRAALEARAQRSIVPVRLAGDQLEVLDDCAAAATYAYRAVTPKADRLRIRNADELKASLPLGVASLSAALERSGELNVRMTLVGRRESTLERVTSAELKGPSCSRATHVISAMTVGAFELFTGRAVALAGGANVAGAGVTGDSRSERQTLTRDGKDTACERATPDDKAPPAGCSAIVAIELLPLGVTRSEMQPAPVDLGTLRLKVVTPVDARCDQDWAYGFAELDDAVAAQVQPPLKTSVAQYLAAKRRAEAAYRNDQSQAEQATARAALDATQKKLSAELRHKAKREPVLALVRAHLAYEALDVDRESGEAKKEAAQARQELEAARPKLPPTLERRGTALALALDWRVGLADERAHQEFESALTSLSFYEDEIGALAGLADAMMLTRTGKLPEALEAYGRLLAGKVRDRSLRHCALFNRANLAARSGVYDVALAASIELLDMGEVSFRPDHAENWAATAIAHLGGIDRVALRTAKPATAAAILRYSGWKSAEAGNLFAAAKAWRAALDVGGRSVLAPFLVAELTAAYDALGDRPRAEEVWARRSEFTLKSPWAEELKRNAPPSELANADAGIAELVSTGLRPPELPLPVSNGSASDAAKPALRSLLQTCFEQTKFGDASIPVRVLSRPGEVPTISVDEGHVAESACLKKLAPSELSILEAPFDARIDVIWGYPGGWY